MSERIDKILVELKLVDTRSKAQVLISQGIVFCNGNKVLKPSEKCTIQDKIEILEEYFVSRGAYKLEKALADFSIDVKDLVACDIGASTGGFTEVLLKRGVKKVFAIDVGSGQLADSLLTDSRVVNLEGVNIKDGIELSEKADIAVVDLSFISVALVIDQIFNLLKEESYSIILVKPQFEAGRDRVGKNGIVKDDIAEIVFKEVKSKLSNMGYKVLKETEAPIRGKTGNKEFLILLSRKDL